MRKSNPLEDYTFEVKYSDDDILTKERLRYLARYMIKLGIKEGIIPSPPGYDDSIDISLELQSNSQPKISRDYVETPTANDIAYIAGTSITSKVPLVGEIFNIIFTDPAIKRRDDWIESLEERIRELENKYPNITETIKESQLAISATFYACSMALKTTNNEKLEAFQNIILNAALKPNYEEYKVQMFLSIIDSFTEWHIRLLNYFSNPKNAILKHNPKFKLGTLRAIKTMHPFFEIYPEAKSELNSLSIVMDDLHYRGLIDVSKKYLYKSYDTKDTLIKSGYPYNKRTTEFGDELLNFIKSPE